MITVTARIVNTGKISMYIYVLVRAGDQKNDKTLVTHRCLIIYVAIDESGYPIKFRNFFPESKEDRLL